MEAAVEAAVAFSVAVCTGGGEEEEVVTFSTLAKTASTPRTRAMMKTRKACFAITWMMMVLNSALAVVFYLQSFCRPF